MIYKTNTSFHKVMWSNNIFFNDYHIIFRQIYISKKNNKTNFSKTIDQIIFLIYIDKKSLKIPI